MQWQPRLTLSTAATADPVSIDDARSQCRVDFNDDDTLLLRKIKSATRAIETILDRQLCTATWVAKASGFPVYSATNPTASMFLPRPPLQSVTSIAYLDPSGDSQTFSSSSYTVETPTRGQGAVHLNNGVIWPTTLYHPAAVTVTFVAGYGDDGDVPDTLKDAVLALVAHQYWNRGDESVDVPEFIRNLAYAESWGSEI